MKCRQFAFLLLRTTTASAYHHLFHRNLQLIEMTPVENKLGNIEAQYPLSFLQQGMLFEGLSAPESGINIEQLICDLHEDLNISFFKQAWQKVVERHAILRTSFCWEGVKDPFQE